MERRNYTVEEANSLLPHLAPALVELRDKSEEVAKIRAEMARIASGNGWSERRAQWSRTLERVAELMDRLRGWGVELRDVSIGLVDFPAFIEGREAFLCWRLGEPEVAYWHFPEDGFPGRKPL
jgi:hypothetical protein